MKLRDVFWIGLAIWWGGGLVGRLSGIRVIHEVSVNIVGSLTCLLGLFLFGRWAWRKLSGTDQAPAAGHHASDSRTGLKIGEGMGIFSTISVPEEARDVIERAIQNDMFKPKGKTEQGWQLLYIQTPTQDWLAVVQVTDAIMVMSAYKTTAETVDKQAADYLSA